MEYIATFGSTHKVLQAEKVLKEKDISFRLIPTPKKLASVCDLSLTFGEEDKEAILAAFKEGGVNMRALYRKEGDDYVQV